MRFFESHHIITTCQMCENMWPNDVWSPVFKVVNSTSLYVRPLLFVAGSIYTSPILLTCTQMSKRCAHTVLDVSKPTILLALWCHWRKWCSLTWNNCYTLSLTFILPTRAILLWWRNASPLTQAQWLEDIIHSSFLVLFFFFFCCCRLFFSSVLRKVYNFSSIILLLIYFFLSF